MERDTFNGDFMVKLNGSLSGNSSYNPSRQAVFAIKSP